MLAKLSASQVLIISALIFSVELTVLAIFLIQRKLFHWLNVGFWSWVAFFLYFILSPLGAVLSGNLENHDFYLNLSGGPRHALWITFVIVIGILVFFIVYFRTHPKSIKLPHSINPSPKYPRFWLWLFLFLGFGGFSLIASRSGITSWGGDATVISGRFSGEVTGYQQNGYVFMFYPIILLNLWPKPAYRVWGVLLGLVFLVFSLPHAWSRYITISMIIALVITYLIKQKKTSPPIGFIAILLFCVLLFQARGHTTWDLSNIGASISETVTDIKGQGLALISGVDTQMLPIFWVESYLTDTWTGHTFGIPLLNYILFGWIPGRFFPQKYFMVDWLNAQQESYPLIYSQVLYGSKSSLIGSFYQMGGFIGVILLMAGAGWLCRRFDAFFDPDTPIITKALGVTLMSTFWMVWGSSETWGLQSMGTMAMPYLAGVLFFFRSWSVNPVPPIQKKAKSEIR